MTQHKYLLVQADVLPEVFGKVLQAKQLLASGEVANISAAAKQAGISRSAFYKYKDCVFDAETGRDTLTVVATLLDKTGALQTLLSGISAAGGAGAGALYCVCSLLFGADYFKSVFVVAICFAGIFVCVLIGCLIAFFVTWRAAKKRRAAQLAQAEED